MVGMELRQQLKLAQQLVMTPQLQQAIKLLQLSRTELVDMVQQELEENPVLEDLVDPPDRAVADRDTADRTEVTSKPTEQEAMTGANEIDWEKYLENYANQAPSLPPPCPQHIIPRPHGAHPRQNSKGWILHLWLK